MYQLD
jgi:hypothetical protein